jgi:hypothetical protein
VAPADASDSVGGPQDVRVDVQWDGEDTSMTWGDTDDTAPEIGQGGTANGVVSAVPTPDTESRLMEEDTMPYQTDVYRGFRKIRLLGK